MVFKDILSRQLQDEQVNKLLQTDLTRILNVCGPVHVYLFGSAARGCMTDSSDLDFLVVLDDDVDMREGKRQYYSSPGERNVPVDMIFLSKSQFAVRSITGGVCFVCREEEILLVDKPTP
jgi:predicted nucleotidyltransferase